MAAMMQKLKDYWWLLTTVAAGLVGIIVLWGNLPGRVERVEAGQEEQQEQITELRELSGKLDGYIASNQQLLNTLVHQQQSAERPVPETPTASSGVAPHTAPADRLAPAVVRYWDEREQWYWCSKNEQWWWADEAGNCE